MKTKQEIEKLTADALRVVKVEFSNHPSNTSTHELMARWMSEYLNQHGVSATVAYIVNVTGRSNSKAVGVFKVFPYPSISEVEFEVMIS